MPANEGTNREEAKEGFLEHLRQVHFLLVAIVAGLLVTLLAEDDAKPAREELRQIRSLLDSWDPQFVHAYLSKQVDAKIDWRRVDRLISNWDWTSKAIENRPPPWLDRLHLTDAPYMCDIAAPSESDLTNHVVVPRPDNLNGFRQTWDALSKQRRLVYPASISSNVWVFEFDSRWDAKPKLRGYREVSAENVQNSSRTMIRQSLFPGQMQPLRTGLLELETQSRSELFPERPFGIRSVNGQSLFTQTLADAGEAYCFHFDLNDPAADVLHIDFAGTIPRTNSLNQNRPIYPKGSPFGEKFAVIACSAATNMFQGFELFTHWPPQLLKSRFDVAFPNLESLRAKFGDSSWERLGRELAELSEGGKRTFQILGLEIPQRLIGLWGPILVLAVQLYFWRHLSAFIRRFPKTAPDEFPCALVYGGWFDALFTYFTSVILPIGLVFWTGLSVGQNKLAAWMLGIAALALGILTWKELDRLACGVWTRRAKSWILRQFKRYPFNPEKKPIKET